MFGHDHSDGESGKRRVWVSISAGALVGVVFILYMITFTVREGEYAVLKTFGRISRTIEEPGLYWMIPLVQKATIHDARLQITDSGRLQQTATKDGKPVLVMFYFTWKIDDVRKYDTSFKSYADAEKMLKTTVLTEMGTIFGARTFDDFIYAEDETPAGTVRKSRFESIEEETLKRVEEKALRDFGIEMKQVGIKRLGLPEAVSNDVFERMKEERTSLAEDYRSRGRSEATKIKTRAERDGDLILYTAQARAKAIRTEGEKIAATFYGVFADEPELHEFLKSLETLRLLARKTTIILTPDAPPFNLLGKGAIPWLKGNENEKDEGRDE